MSEAFQDVMGTCEKCQGGTLQIGLAIEQTYVAGIPDFPGQSDMDGQTISPGGPGKLIHVIKCKSCGASWRCAKEPYQGPKQIPLPPIAETRRERDFTEWESQGAFMNWLHRADDKEFPFWLKDGNSSFQINRADREQLVRGMMIGMSWTTRFNDEEE